MYVHYVLSITANALKHRSVTVLKNAKIRHNINLAMPLSPSNGSCCRSTIDAASSIAKRLPLVVVPLFRTTTKGFPAIIDLRLRLFLVFLHLGSVIVSQKCRIPSPKWFIPIIIITMRTISYHFVLANRKAFTHQ